MFSNADYSGKFEPTEGVANSLDGLYEIRFLHITFSPAKACQLVIDASSVAVSSEIMRNDGHLTMALIDLFGL
jgi:hypothetical protein